MRTFAGFLFCLSLAGGQAYAACDADVLSIEEWSIRSNQDEALELTLTLKSNLKKDIRMIDADFKFRDALGGHIAADTVNRDLAIPSGTAVTMTKRWPNTFERLLKLNHDEVSTTTCVRSVLYEDGTKEEFR
ncbi:hypothetical protein ABID21_001930 [Pseudorhizobium tarimense]|uniref:Uncharacterized protein n=1 Tax=Pseudorhizobium tarimense TaxID=1079109 RepID=A0ABV2H5K1_9HYPH|nr:hypothetical protein [Pseudorhizobium tarimense]MCJ8519022.1 hypothetical protein [Pseudorhizobium tarimense]